MKRTFFYISVLFIIMAALASADVKTTAGIKSLQPSKIGEFATFGKNPEDENDWFVSNPNGEFYHFWSYVGYGDSQWDVFCGYEESFTASSTLAPTANYSYGADNLSNEKMLRNYRIGGFRDAAWCEGVKGYGIGERVNMSIRTKSCNEGNDNDICFTGLMIVNGYAKDAATWKNNSRVKTLRLYVGGKPWCDLQLKDTIKPQIFEFEKAYRIYPAKSGKKIPEKGAFTKPCKECGVEKVPVYQTDLTFEIVEVYPGSKYDDTCITGIALDVSGGLY